MRTMLRIRVSPADARYGSGLVDGAFVMRLFGDAATELLVRHDGDEGLFRAYQFVEFLVPVAVGDYVEVEAEMLRVGRTSRDVAFVARKSVAGSSGAPQILNPPIVVARARGTCVVPLERQRPRG
ncbi:MAG TPA: hotdog domain-containing protein [Thermoanaerobaculia bacterium]|nr:hotdog domain-containing protein [Thermoanaerobaculia bacterium]